MLCGGQANIMQLASTCRWATVYAWPTMCPGSKDDLSSEAAGTINAVQPACP